MNNITDDEKTKKLRKPYEQALQKFGEIYRQLIILLYDNFDSNPALKYFYDNLDEIDYRKSCVLYLKVMSPHKVLLEKKDLEHYKIFANKIIFIPKIDISELWRKSDDHVRKHISNYLLLLLQLAELSESYKKDMLEKLKQDKIDTIDDIKKEDKKNTDLVNSVSGDLDLEQLHTVVKLMGINKIIDFDVIFDELKKIATKENIEKMQKDLTKIVGEENKKPLIVAIDVVQTAIEKLIKPENKKSKIDKLFEALRMCITLFNQQVQTDVITSADCKKSISILINHIVESKKDAMKNFPPLIKNLLTTFLNVDTKKEMTSKEKYDAFLDTLEKSAGDNKELKEIAIRLKQTDPDSMSNVIKDCIQTSTTQSTTSKSALIQLPSKQQKKKK